MILLTSDSHGCVYSIDSEGCLYYMPKHLDGSINFEELAEVESVDELDDEDISQVHSQLITMSKSIGHYFC